jgi:hypothetical protein
VQEKSSVDGQSRSVSVDRRVIQAHAGVAQLAEQLICNQQVLGSSPIASSRRRKRKSTRSGGVPKWPKGADCKSAAVRLQRFESSPHHGRSMMQATKNIDVGTDAALHTMGEVVPPHPKAGVAQLVELQPSKLDVAGSNPVARSDQDRGARTHAPSGCAPMPPVPPRVARTRSALPAPQTRLEVAEGSLPT